MLGKNYLQKNGLNTVKFNCSISVYNFILLKRYTGIPGLWTEVLDAGLWTLDPGRRTLGAGFWMLDPGRWTLDAGCWTVDFGH